MSEDKKYSLAEIGVIGVATPIFFALMMVVAFPLAMWSAYVAMKLWNWFPAIYFHLNPISLWMALGFSYVAGVFRKQIIFKDHELDWKRELFSSIAGPAMIFGIGYLIHLKIQ